MSKKTPEPAGRPKKNNPERSLCLNQLRSVDRKLKRVMWEHQVLDRERARILKSLEQIDQAELAL